jgi:phosphatidylserine decarboxylase
MGTDAPTALTPAPITSAQPGGGFCMDLELTWGRWRRAWLRRFRPGYVRGMAALRRGNCDSCTHDVIDPRDLKYYRNVCGHWFAPADDRFAWRGRLQLARHGLAELIVFGGLFAVLTVLCVGLAVAVHPICWLPAAACGALFLFVVSFFRDPERVPPADIDAVVSPADGKVTQVEEVDDPDFPGGRAFRVSIFLSVFNVHVNRAPRPGRVAALRYFPGAFLDARHNECAVRNEQFWTDFTDARTGQLVRVKQVAGAIARRIVCWVREAEEVQVGERYGMIKFGSRTDVLVPAGTQRDVTIKVGDKVTGGKSVLFRVTPPGTGSTSN